MPMAAPDSLRTTVLERRAWNGWPALALVVLWFIAAIALFISTGVAAEGGAISDGAAALRVVGAALMVALGIFLGFGFFTLQPNEARVLILFGSYKGTVRDSGFHWANPLYSRGRRTGGATPV